LSDGVREAVLAAVLSSAVLGSAPPVPAPGTARVQSAVTLRAALAADPAGLTAGEAALLAELLDQLSVDENGIEQARPRRHA
jgi:hypothetical protein